MEAQLKDPMMLRPAFAVTYRAAQMHAVPVSTVKAA
jgi:hypothetical protein